MTMKGFTKILGIAAMVLSALGCWALDPAWD